MSKKHFNISQIQDVNTNEKLEKIYDMLISVEAYYDENDDEVKRFIAYEAMEKIDELIRKGKQ